MASSRIRLSGKCLYFALVPEIHSLGMSRGVTCCLQDTEDKQLVALTPSLGVGKPEPLFEGVLGALTTFLIFVPDFGFQ